MTRARSPHGLKPAMQYRGLRFPRTAAEAFRDFTYGAAIERPWPPLWRRMLNALWRM